MRNYLVILGAAALCASAAATAQQGAAVAAFEACHADTQKFCQGVPMGGGRVRDCLAAHLDDLTPSCQTVVKKAGGHAPAGATAGADPIAAEVAKSCEPDARSFCKGVQPGGGHIVDCLIDHQKDISDACYAALKKRQDAQDPGAPKNP